MLDWAKTFAIILQTSKPSILRRSSTNRGNDAQEFYARGFGHAVMVLNIHGELLYKGYRPNVTGHREFREAFHNIYHNVQDMTRLQIREALGTITDILRQGVPAVIRDERKRYRPRHERILSQTTTAEIGYKDWHHNDDEVRSILIHIDQDEQKEKYYSLRPDTARESGDFPGDASIHNCVTWIIETQRESIISLLLPPILSGNVSQLAQHLQETGDNR